MLIKALISFAGKVAMYAGEIREVAEKEIAEDLIKAGYAVEQKEEKTSKEEITPKAAETPVEVPELPEEPVEASEEEAEKAVEEEPAKETKKTSKKSK